jgi:hypothetical protein
MLRMVPSSGLVLLSLALFQFSSAQEPSDKPDVPIPKTAPAVPVLPHKTSATPRAGGCFRTSNS